VFEVSAKSVHKEAWPLLHYGADDATLFHGVTNTVHQYSRADGFKGEMLQQNTRYRWPHCLVTSRWPEQDIPQLCSCQIEQQCVTPAYTMSAHQTAPHLAV
jgi:hypothetical protein